MVMKMVCKRIRELREDHDLRQINVVRLLGMSQTGYYKYETGENDIPTAVLLLLADHHDASVVYLLDRTDKEFSPHGRNSSDDSSIQHERRDRR